MSDRLTSAVVSIAALGIAAFVDLNGGDPSPYISVATLAFGFAAGKQVGKKSAGKT